MKDDSTDSVPRKEFQLTIEQLRGDLGQLLEDEKKKIKAEVLAELREETHLAAASTEQIPKSKTQAVRRSSYPADASLLYEFYAEASLAMEVYAPVFQQARRDIAKLAPLIAECQRSVSAVLDRDAFHFSAFRE